MSDRARTSSLRVSLLRRSLLLGLTPLILLAVAAVVGLRALDAKVDDSIVAGRQTVAEETVSARLSSEAGSVGREIVLVLSERLNDVVTWARQPVVIDGAAVGADLAAQTGLSGLDANAIEARFVEQRSLESGPLADAFLSSEQARIPEFLDIVFTEQHGFAAGVVGTEEDFIQSDEAWWKDAWENGVHVGAVTFRPESGEHVIALAARIDNDRGERVGVLRASLSIGFIHDIADRRAEDLVDVSVITSSRQLLAETASAHDPARIGAADLGAGQFSDGVETALVETEGSLITDGAVYGYAPVEIERATGEAASGDAALDWFVVAQQDAGVALAPLSGFDALGDEVEAANRQLVLIILVVVVLAALAALALAAVSARQIVVPIQRLTDSARLAADHTLPGAVSAMREADEDVSIDGIDAVSEVGLHEELAQLAASFNSVQRTALELAVAQSNQRRSTARMFANLGRRNQSLVKRQLRLIDELEHAEEDPDRLASLFRLDHLATRMRRNAESLLVVAGHRSAGRRNQPVRIELVAQGALGEIEDYERVIADQFEPMALTGRAVADVAHILAELLENAVAVSPPETDLVVTRRVHVNGYALTIADRGIGMSELDMATANERLRCNTAFEELTTTQLGHHVVARLASRHGITVRLSPSEKGGVTAQVILPKTIVAEDTAAGPSTDAPADVEATVVPASLAYGPATDDDAPTPSTATPDPGLDTAATPAATTERTETVPTDGDIARRSDDGASAEDSVDPTVARRHPDAAPTTTGDVAAADDDIVVLDPARRQDDASAPGQAPAAEAGVSQREVATDVPAVTRRVSRRQGAPGATAQPTPSRTTDRTKRTVATTASEEEVSAEAERTGNRWSSFQSARRSAADDVAAEQAPSEEKPDVGQ